MRAIGFVETYLEARSSTPDLSTFDRSTPRKLAPSSRAPWRRTSAISALSKSAWRRSASWNTTCLSRAWTNWAMNALDAEKSHFSTSDMKKSANLILVCRPEKSHSSMVASAKLALVRLAPAKEHRRMVQRLKSTSSRSAPVRSASWNMRPDSENPLRLAPGLVKAQDFPCTFISPSRMCSSTISSNLRQSFSFHIDRSSRPNCMIVPMEETRYRRGGAMMLGR